MFDGWRRRGRGDVLNVAAVPRLDDRSSFLNLPRLYWGCRRKPAMAINGRR